MSRQTTGSNWTSMDDLFEANQNQIACNCACTCLFTALFAKLKGFFLNYKLRSYSVISSQF